MTGPYNMDDSPEDIALEHVRMALSRLRQPTVIDPGPGEQYIKEHLCAAATALDDERDVLAEWRAAYAVHGSAPDATRDVHGKTLEVLSAYEAIPEPKRFDLIIEALAVFSFPPRDGASSQPRA